PSCCYSTQTSPTSTLPLPLHDALPISSSRLQEACDRNGEISLHQPSASRLLHFALRGQWAGTALRAEAGSRACCPALFMLMLIHHPGNPCGVAEAIGQRIDPLLRMSLVDQ